MKNPQSTFRLRICFFTVQEQESPQVALEVKILPVAGMPISGCVCVPVIV